MADAVGPILIAVVAVVLVVVLWRRGRRADQGRARVVRRAPIEEQTSAELWRDISEGHDPTEQPGERSE
jgi:hypothetical protein